MSKMMVATHSIIRNIFISLLIIITTFFLFLKGGIWIDNLKIGSFYVEKLYLKLDKKLIIRVEKVIIPKKKKNAPLPNLEKTLSKIKNILRYFQSIELKEVHFKNNHYRLFYSNKVFYMTNNEFEIAAMDVDYIGARLHASIESIYLKKYDIRLSGKLIYNVPEEDVLIEGEAHYRDIFATFVLKKKENHLYYTLKSKEFTQFKSIVEQFTLPPKINQWATEYLKAKSYKIEYLKGVATVNKSGITLIPSTLKAQLFTKDVTILFHPKLDPVRAEAMRISFDDKLDFNLTKPYFLDRPLEGSRVSIEGLLQKKAIIKLDLNATTPYDKAVDKILKAYKITIPIIQTDGVAYARLFMDIALKTKKVTVDATIDLDKAKIKIGSAPLSIEKGSVKIEEKNVKLSDFVVDSSWYKIALDGDINLKKEKIELLLDIKTLKLGKKERDYLLIENSKQPLLIDYSHNIKFTLPKLNSGINMFAKDSTVVMDIADINKIKPYLTNVPMNIDGGNLKIKTKDFLEYQFSGLINNKECFFYENNSTCLIVLPIKGTLSSEGLYLNAFDKRLFYNSKTSTIKVKNLHFNLEKFLQNKQKRDTIKSKEATNILLQAKKSIISYKTHHLLTDTYDINLSSQGDFSFEGVLGRDRVVVKQSKKYMSIQSNRVTDKMLHPLINFTGLQKGKYSIKILKNREGVSTGEITIYGGVMRGFKTYNNVMAFINTIPSLATLNRPGFSDKGFDIKKGTIKFRLAGDILNLDSIVIEGVSSSISGRGVINIAKKTLQVDIFIMTAREVGKIIGDIPIVGYILMGDKKSVTVGLEITGTLNKPLVKNSAIKDTLFVPLKILKRTLATPEYIYQKQKEKAKLKEEELDLF